MKRDYKVRALSQAFCTSYFVYEFVKATNSTTKYWDGIAIAAGIFLTLDLLIRVRKEQNSQAVFQKDAEEYFGETVEEFRNREHRRHPEGLHNQKFSRRNERLTRAQGYSRRHFG